MARKAPEQTPAQKFHAEEEVFDAANQQYNASVEACKHCGGRKGYNPVTGVELKKGHHASCITLADKRAMVTTYNTNY